MVANNNFLVKSPLDAVRVLGELWGIEECRTHKQFKIERRQQSSSAANPITLAVEISSVDSI